MEKCARMRWENLQQASQSQQQPRQTLKEASQRLQEESKEASQRLQESSQKREARKRLRELAATPLIQYMYTHATCA